eukprot:753858-Hanusia_phi.AAC.4
MAREGAKGDGWEVGEETRQRRRVEPMQDERRGGQSRSEQQTSHPLMMRNDRDGCVWRERYGQARRESKRSYQMSR